MSNNSLPGAFLFDLDDTIIAHGAAAEGLWESLCFEHASMIEGLSAETLLQAVGDARDWYWSDPERHRNGRLNLFQARRQLVELAFKNLGLDNLEVAHKIANAYSTQREELVKLFPGSVDILKFFRSSGKKMALVTNGASDMQRSKIERFGLGEYFDYILVEGEFGVGKPDKSVFLHALNKLNCSENEAWMVGDDLSRDIAGAQDVGIYSVWVDWKNEGLPGDSPVCPDKIINAISELV